MRTLRWRLILTRNVAYETCVPVPTFTLVRVTFLTVAYFRFVALQRWNATYLPTKDWAAPTLAVNLPAATRVSLSCGRTLTSTLPLVVPLFFARYVVLSAGFADAVQAPFVVVITVATFAK